MVADKATNTLIITADRDDYQIIEGVIQKLDVPRPMVYIEALIMEVSVNKSFNIGVEWRGLKDVGTADLKGLGRTRPASAWPASPGTSIIPQLNSSTGAFPCRAASPWGSSARGSRSAASFSQHRGGPPGLPERYGRLDPLDAAAPDAQQRGCGDQRGEERSLHHPQDTSAVVPGQTFGSSYEYKDVGVILKITPNINEDQFVRLKIDQQVTKLAGAADHDTPTTLKRTAKTTVVIKDNETVVIGGMIDDSTSVETAQVPCIGDIPLVGWLFKTMSTRPVEDEPLRLHHPPHHPEPGGGRRHLREEARTTSATSRRGSSG